jgi:hypothetical protein
MSLSKPCLPLRRSPRLRSAQTFALCILDKDTTQVVLSNLDVRTLLLMRTMSKDLWCHVKDNMFARAVPILTMTFTHSYKRVAFPCTTRASSALNAAFCWQAFVSIVKYKESMTDSLDDMQCKIGRLSNELDTRMAIIRQKHDECSTLFATGDVDGAAVVYDQLKALFDENDATIRHTREAIKLYKEAVQALEGKVKTWVKHGGSELHDIFRRMS